MNYAYTEEQELLRNTSKDFLTNECPKSKVREIQASDECYSPDIWKQMAEMGWLGIMLPEEYGGAEQGLFELAVLFEEIGRAAFPSPMFSTVVLGATAILEAGTEEQKKQILPKVASGDTILALALAEPQADYVPQFYETQAVEKDGSFVINGTKLLVENAHVADHILVVARTGDVDAEGNGISVFIVDKGIPGLNITPLLSVADDKPSEVILKDVTVPASAILGEKGKGWTVIKKVLQIATAIQCVQATGVMDQLLKMGTDYTKERIQFGRPIGSFQAVQHRLADIYTCVNGARWLSYQAVSKLQRGLSADMEVAIAKTWICDKMSHQVTFGIQQVHGGIGIDLEHDLHFYFNLARQLELSYGGLSVHHSTIETNLTMRGGNVSFV